MLVAKGNDAFCHLHGIKATIFPEDFEFAALAHADDGLVITKACHVTSHDYGQTLESLCLGAARTGDEIGPN